MQVMISKENKELFNKINEMVLLRSSELKPDVNRYASNLSLREHYSKGDTFVQVSYKDITSVGTEETILVCMDIDKFLEFVPLYRAYNDSLLDNQSVVLELIRDTHDPVDTELYFKHSMVGESLGICYMRHFPKSRDLWRIDSKEDR